MGLVHRWDFKSGAKFSPCRKYRYSLFRTWDNELPVVEFIGLNPSIANEKKNDNTIRRCIQFAKDWGYGTIIMLNAFGYCATDPRDMKACEDPIGVGNDKEIIRMSHRADLIVACWGAHGGFENRDMEVMAILRVQELEVYCLGVTKNGFPKHPLYLSGDEKPVRYKGRTL